MTLRSTIREHGLACVVHGKKEDTPRPDGFAYVIWQGSVEPLAALDGDVWINTG